MIRAYWLNCSPLFNKQELSRILHLLTPSRQEKISRLQDPEKKAQSAAAGLLIHHFLGDVELSYGPHGKPYIAHNNQFFNLSHSGPYVILVLSNDAIGVDMEQPSPIRPSVMQRCFTDDEQTWIGNDTTRFTHLWTMKEAYMKLLGTGFSLSAKNISLVVPPYEGYDSVHNCYWQFPKFDVPLTICSNSRDTAEVIPINLKDLL